MMSRKICELLWFDGFHVKMDWSGSKIRYNDFDLWEISLSVD